MTAAKPIAAIWWRVSTKAQTDMSPDTQILEAREMLESRMHRYLLTQLKSMTE